MSRRAPTVAEIEAIFPIKADNISAITGQPDRTQLEPLLKDLRQCAASIPTLKGGGLYGHVAFIMPTIDYLALPGATAFVTTASPGVLVYLPTETTVGQRDDRRNLYHEDLFHFTTEQNIQTALKNIFFTKIDKSTHCILEDPHVGYANVTIRQLLTHVMGAYGEKTSAMLSTNMEAMRDPYDVSLPSMDQFFTRQNEHQQFAVGTDSGISDGLWIMNTFHVIQESGLLHKGCRKWEANTAAGYKTKAQFIKDFTAYHKDMTAKMKNDAPTAYSVHHDAELQSLRSTAVEHGNKLNEIIDAMETMSQSDTASIPASISTTATARTTAADTEVTKLTALIATLRDQVANAKRDKGGGKGGGGGGRNNGGAGKGRTAMRTEAPAANGPNDRRLTRSDDGRTEKRFSNTNMCHTHGYDVDDAHDSRNCFYPDKHHDKTATKANPKGACELYKHLCT